MLHFDLPKEQSSIIKVIGVGGGGSNAVNHMFEQGIEGVNFVICNTDEQALEHSQIPNKIHLGPEITKGLGAGSVPEIGRKATEESAQMVKDILNQLKFLKWTKDTPKLLQITRATFQKNPCFNKVFGVIPVATANDLVAILPGLFVIAGILGTFVGIAGGLEELGGMNLKDLTNTQNIMDRFLQEIAFAMKTSIFGIVFSLCMHIFNTLFSPERVFFSMVDRFETSLDLLWYRADNNEFPVKSKDFDEHRDATEALAEDAVGADAKYLDDKRNTPGREPAKAS